MGCNFWPEKSVLYMESNQVTLPVPLKLSTIYLLVAVYKPFLFLISLEKKLMISLKHETIKPDHGCFSQ